MQLSKTMSSTSIRQNDFATVNFDVIDTMRFIAMCSIVWGHCNLGSETTVYHNYPDIILQSVVLQAGKIGTIIFFLISGFLIAPKIKNYTPLGFLKLRFRSTILPWLVFVAIFVLLNLVNSEALKSAIQDKDLKHILLINLDIAKNSVFYFAYWFILVFLISALILIVLKKYTETWWLGLILGLATLFYSVNLHCAWIQVHHTKAFLGYAFFMWIGIQVSGNYPAFKKILNAIPWRVFIAAWTTAFAIACYEGFRLSHAGCADPYASIRFSNIITSLITFGCLFKLGKIECINSLEPRRLVYGIYLLHNVLVYEMISFYTRYFNNKYIVNNALTLFVAEVIAFLFVISTSIVLVNALSGKYANVFDSTRNSIRELAQQIRYRLSPDQYIRLAYVQTAYKITRFALIIMLPCLPYFYFLSKT